MTDSILVVVFAVMYMIAVAQKKILEKRFYDINNENDDRRELLKEACEDVCFFLAGFVIIVKLFDIIYR